jgi:hypothetical protein
MTFRLCDPTLEASQAHKARLQRITHRGKRGHELKKGGITMAQEFYRIRVKGLLDQHWSSRLEGMTIMHLENGETLLTGPLADQAALYGVLYQLQNLGVPLIAVCRIPPDESRP